MLCACISLFCITLFFFRITFVQIVGGRDTPSPFFQKPTSTYTKIQMEVLLTLLTTYYIYKYNKQRAYK